MAYPDDKTPAYDYNTTVTTRTNPDGSTTTTKVTTETTTRPPVYKCPQCGYDTKYGPGVWCDGCHCA